MYSPRLECLLKKDTLNNERWCARHRRRSFGFGLLHIITIAPVIVIIHQARYSSICRTSTFL